MKLFEVYSLFDIEPVKAKDCTIVDSNNTEYLDLYGGHAVISIGHCHPHYVQKVGQQLSSIGFYSNSVQNPLQVELAQKLGELSGYTDYSLFLTNSGAEANENALKLASFHTKRKRVISFAKGFHGRTSAAVAITDIPKIVAPLNASHETTIVEWEDLEAVKREIAKGDVAAVIIEGIQGIGGIRIPNPSFLENLQATCRENDVVFILDEIQSGYGRSGKFFAHQYSHIKPDLITVAKGMGNGFPIGGVLISPHFQPSIGLLGTTFGGNHLGCAAAIAVLDVMKDQRLVENATEVGDYLMNQLAAMPEIKEVRGAGLMIGLEFEQPIASIRKELLFSEQIFTGVTGTHVIRLLPPLTLTKQDADRFVLSLKKVVQQVEAVQS